MSRLIVAFESDAVSKRVTELLLSGALNVRAVCRTGAEVIRQVRYMGSGVVLCGVKFSDMTADALYEDLEGKAYLLVIAKPQELEICENNRVFRLPLPINRYDLCASARMLSQLEEMNRPRPDRGSTDAELISYAKGMLMDKRSMSESEAHRYLQKLSMASGQPLAGIARQIINELQKD